ncbi:hypothetical protein JJJ17_10335 [Paracoccus caeni]|uniref:Uncharacterized protein n=1 Tax=Paracoccus caeni TaxID=657651 RepID=A0A934SCG9_9RHOB|nr:hypothetical protein [Paracoccus caeni]MBK4216321.1 hypothetical protein [Paracoccus caeni]
MALPFNLLTPFWKAPFSGDVEVSQEIHPRFWSSDIKGSPYIEDKVVTEVASYGKQLGKVLEALQALSLSTGTPLPEIDALTAEITEVKRRSIDELRAEAVAALERLRKVDETAWRDVVGRE